MLLTEEEARKGWCIGPESCGIGRGGYRLCIASDCLMGWRWAWTPGERAHAERVYRETDRRLKPTLGYCGLAGKPEE